MNYQIITSPSGHLSDTFGSMTQYNYKIVNISYFKIVKCMSVIHKLICFDFNLNFIYLLEYCLKSLLRSNREYLNTMLHIHHTTDYYLYIIQSLKKCYCVCLY